jgi:hypothetical protein
MNQTTMRAFIESGNWPKQTKLGFWSASREYVGLAARVARKLDGKKQEINAVDEVSADILLSFCATCVYLRLKTWKTNTNAAARSTH